MQDFLLALLFYHGRLVRRRRFRPSLRCCGLGGTQFLQLRCNRRQVVGCALDVCPQSDKLVVEFSLIGDPSLALLCCIIFLSHASILLLDFQFLLLLQLHNHNINLSGDRLEGTGSEGPHAQLALCKPHL